MHYLRRKNLLYVIFMEIIALRIFWKMIRERTANVLWNVLLSITLIIMSVALLTPRKFVPKIVDREFSYETIL